jgi:hypothetical protein
MTIFIDDKKVTDKVATGFFSRPDDLVRQIVRAWRQSNVSHCFESKKGFKKAVRRNRKTLKSPDKIKTLFRPCNYIFSTEAKNGEGTLYFKDRAAKQTGRLRQQHPKGPLAKIDKKAREHLFLSKKRYDSLVKWHEQTGGQLPRVYPYELRAKVGKHHIEFACEGKSVSEWHYSRGTVKMCNCHLECSINFALENILGIRN